MHPFFFFLVSGLILFVNRSINFDMHHDGLITTNMLEIRNGFENEGPWPFNQYGVTWLIPYLPIILTGDSNSIYERANWVSLIIYVLTLIISFFTARKFTGTTQAIFVPIFLAATASLGSLRTWPSVSAMLYQSGFLLAAVSYLSRSTSLRNLKRIAFLMGALIPLIIFSRVQVGIFLLLVFSIVVFKFGLSKTRRYFFFGFISTSFLIVYFLAKNNWLKSALMDTFVYSLNYLTNDETRVIPYFTLIGSVIVFVLCYTLLSDKFPLKPAQLLIFAMASGLISLLALYVKTVLSEGLDSISFYTILIRRFFVSTLIGTFFYWLVSQTRVVIRERNNVNWSQDSKMLALILVSAGSLLQLVPLFDSTHAWWASPPLVILLALLIGRVIRKNLRIIRIDLVLSALALAMIPLLLFSVQSYKYEQTRLIHFGSLFVSNAMSLDSEVSEQNQLSKMVFSKASTGSKFLNLCINANIFLTTKGYKSATRFYISWPNMRGYPEFVDATRASQPDFILTCSDLPNPAAGILTEEDRNDLRVSQDLIIQQVFSQPKLVGEFISPRDVQWKLWSSK
jgi:hypothetical protein